MQCTWDQGAWAILPRKKIWYAEQLYWQKTFIVMCLQCKWALTLRTMIVSTDSFSTLCIHGIPKKSSQQNSLETALIYCGCRLQTWMKVFWPWLTYLLDLLVPRATISLLCLQTPSSMNQNIFTKFCWLHFLEHPVPLHLPTYSSIISPPLECKHHH